MAETFQAFNPARTRRIDYSGRTIGPLRLARAMRLNIISGAFIMTALAWLWPTAAITVVFLEEQLGASKTQIGLNLTLVLLSTCVALPGAWLFSQFRRRREPWVIMTAIARSFLFGPAIVALLAGYESWRPVLIPVVIACLVLVHAGGVFTSPGWWAWMADLIPDSIRGSFFGRRFRYMLLAQSVAAIAAGWLLDQADTPQASRIMFSGIFGLAALIAVLDPLIFMFIPEPVRPKPKASTFRSTIRNYLEPVRDSSFRMILIAAGAYGFFYNLPLVVLILFLRGESINGTWIGGQAPLWLISLVTVVSAVMTALITKQWGQLADRIGHRVVWILGSLAYFTYVLYFFLNVQNYIWLALLHAGLFGLLFAGQPVAMQNLILAMAPSSRREYYTSVFTVVTSVGAAFGPLIGGWLADRYRVFPDLILPGGQPACYAHLLLLISSVGILLTVPIMVRVPDQKGTTVLPWFGRLISGDLLRLTWNLGVLAGATSIHRKIRALRRINRRDGNTMLPEIVMALDDHDMMLRREAILALGRIGTAEALDLLRWYLFEPDAAVRAQSVKAIARIRGDDTSSMLKRALRDPDSRVRQAAVEALGHSGDCSAGLELRELLTSEPDGEVLACAAVALSRLKSFDALREMLNLTMNSENSTVRSQMLVALADLLSGTSDFDKLWRRDRYWRSSGFELLAKRLQKQAKAMIWASKCIPQQTTYDRRKLIMAMNDEIESLLEDVQSEDWANVLTKVNQLALKLLEIRYGYHGQDEHALEFLTAISLQQAQRYWVISYLRYARDSEASEKAPWDGLALLSLHSLVAG